MLTLKHNYYNLQGTCTSTFYNSVSVFHLYERCFKHFQACKMCAVRCVFILEPCKVKVKSDIETRCGKLSDQQEITYDEIPNLVGQDSVYEQIILEKRQIVQNPTSEYAALKHDDHLYVETTA